MVQGFIKQQRIEHIWTLGTTRTRDLHWLPFLTLFHSPVKFFSLSFSANLHLLLLQSPGWRQRHILILFFFALKYLYLSFYSSHFVDTRKKNCRPKLSHMVITNASSGISLDHQKYHKVQPVKFKQLPRNGVHLPDGFSKWRTEMLGGILMLEKNTGTSTFIFILLTFLSYNVHRVILKSSFFFFFRLRSALFIASAALMIKS